MPADANGARAPGPASESLQGRNRGGGELRRRGGPMGIWPLPWGGG